MTDERLLQLAEDKLNASRKSKDFTAGKEMANESIAASLLVIARNSVPPRTIRHISDLPKETRISDDDILIQPSSVDVGF